MTECRLYSAIVTHKVEIPYVYQEPSILTSSDAGVRLLSQAMVDYWISFAVSQTPNDGKGVESVYIPLTLDYASLTTAMAT